MANMNQYRIPIQLLMMARRRMKRKPINPCFIQMDRMLTALRLNGGVLWKVAPYHKAVLECMERNKDLVHPKKKTAVALHYLRKFYYRKK